MSIIEVGVRGGAIALMLLLSALLLRDGRSVPAARYAALFLLGAAANLMITTPPLSDNHAAWLLPLRVLAVGNPAVFLVTASTLFDDDFAPSWRHLAIWLALVGLNLWGFFSNGPGRFLPDLALALTCVGVALWRVLAGRSDDLVEARRRLRGVFVLSVGLFTAATIVSAILLHGGRNYQEKFGLTDAGGNLLLAAFFAMALLTLAPGDIFRPFATPESPGAAVAPAPADDPRDAPLLATLRRVMGEERAYREEALSIAALAARLGVPEYRLRRLINQRLGYRNFAAFLNGYRLDEVVAALRDATQDEVPILTIALDAGFQSIGPFNRAFKMRTGVTPSAFRRQGAAAD